MLNPTRLSPARRGMVSLVLMLVAVALIGGLACGKPAADDPRPVLKWGADPAGGAPFVYDNPAKPSEVIGFEIDMIEAIAKHLGMRPEMVVTQWDGLLDNMIAGRSDIVMNGIEINDERKAKVDFSQPYYEYMQQLTVRVEDKEKYKSLADLKGQKIGTLSGAEANNVLKREGWADENIIGYDDSSNPYEDLKNGRVEAVLQESIIATHYAGNDAKLFNIPETFAPGRYGIAVRKGDTAMLGKIEEALKLMKENGELAAIYKKWNLWTESQKELGIKEAAHTAAPSSNE